ncbi:DUF4276 family protein [Chloracidobacterium validum]|uniref:DUF4276 family protein n=1 Tax=Chloracidobacterium validum TaxID=2821543 RepID=A0ABX8BC72_9BACT|nr:DUF4276 family protein [Chloracidobacterium validum]
MIRLLILVEGQSEETFVKRTLGPYLARQNVYAEAVVLWTKRLPAGGGFQGGASSWNQIFGNLKRLAGDTNAWITTLLDFYGLPSDFPGLQAMKKSAGVRARVACLEDHLAQKMNHGRFIPFLALHEFEAWLFSSPQVTAQHFGTPGLANKLQSIVDRAGEPELINNGKKTHPKAQLARLVANYKEASDGPLILNKIGIEAIRTACPHFDKWLKKLEALGSHLP